MLLKLVSQVPRLGVVSDQLKGPFPLHFHLWIGPTGHAKYLREEADKGCAD